MTDEQNCPPCPPCPTDPADPAEDEGLCPTCGFFVGAASTCIRCGARTGKRLSVRMVRWLAIAGSIIGVILLWVAAYIKDPPVIPISEINLMTNNALVSIEGHVTNVKHNYETNMLRITVSDDTGDISVMAFNKLREFTEYLGEDNMPGLGDKVRVTGQVSVNSRFGSSIFLSVPERLQVIEPFDPEIIDIGDLTDNMLGEMYKLECNVGSYSPIPTRNGGTLHKFTLEDRTGEIDLVMFDSQFDQLDEETRDLLIRGRSKLHVIIKVSEYNGNLQAQIFEGDDAITKAPRRRHSSRSRSSRSRNDE